MNSSSPCTLGKPTSSSIHFVRYSIKTWINIQHWWSHHNKQSTSYFKLKSLKYWNIRCSDWSVTYDAKVLVKRKLIGWTGHAELITDCNSLQAISLNDTAHHQQRPRKQITRRWITETFGNGSLLFCGCFIPDILPPSPIKCTSDWPLSLDEPVRWSWLTWTS